MSEIIKIKPLENGVEKEKQGTKELKDFPDSIRVRFDKLPDQLKNKILFDRRENEAIITNPIEDYEYDFEGAVSSALGGHRQSLEKMVASFDTETREEFLTDCIYYLFKHGKFRDRFESVSEENLEREVERLLNLFWENRGKRDDLMIFNQEYYDKFFQDRGIITEKITAKKLEIEKLKHSIAAKPRQRRLTRRRIEELKKLEKEKAPIVDELEKYDRQHGNSDLDHIHIRDVSSRQRKEKIWMEAVTITCEHLEPAEFATAIAEKMNKVFSREFSIAQDPKISSSGKISSEELEKSRRIVQAVSQAIEKWNMAHKDEGAFRKTPETRREVRQDNIIKYLISLMESYQRGKRSNKTDDELNAEIKFMEVSLNLLGKSS